MKKPLKGYNRNGVWYNFPLITKKDMKDFEEELRQLDNTDNNDYKLFDISNNNDYIYVDSK